MQVHGMRVERLEENTAAYIFLRQQFRANERRPQSNGFEEIATVTALDLYDVRKKQTIEREKERKKKRKKERGRVE